MPCTGVAATHPTIPAPPGLDVVLGSPARERRRPAGGRRRGRQGERGAQDSPVKASPAKSPPTRHSAAKPSPAKRSPVKQSPTHSAAARAECAAARQGAVGSVLEELFEDRDECIEKRLERTWQKGERAMRHFDEEQQRVASDFMSELALCSEQADDMEAENARLRASVGGLVEQMRTFDAVIGGVVPPAPAHEPGHLPGVAPPDVPLGPPALERAATPLSLAEALGPYAPLSYAGGSC